MSDQRHIVNVGPGGSLKQSGETHTTRADIDAILSALQRESTVVLHFHGGLVTERAGLEIAERMTALYRNVGAYPVSFVWESGFLEILPQNLTKISGTKLFKKILEAVIKRVSKFFDDAQGRGLDGLKSREIEDQLANESPFAELDMKLESGRISVRQGDLSEADLQDEFQEEMGGDLEAILAEDEYLKPEETEGGGKGLISSKLIAVLARIAYKVVKRFVDKRDHGFFPTLVEETLRALYLAEIGSLIWAGMKRNAAAMWASNQGLEGESLHPGRYFLEGLIQIQATRDLKIDLVSHSAGAIAICKMLETARSAALNLHIRNIAFLAPACSATLFLEEIVRRPKGFERFRMFTMADELEKKDRLVKGIYTRSLLYFISGILEDEEDTAIAGLERFYNPPYGRDALGEIAAFLSAESRLALSQTDTGAAPGMRTMAKSHGAFDDDRETLASLQFLVGGARAS